LWFELLRQTWLAVFEKDPYALEVDLLGRAKDASRRTGLPQEFVERLEVRRHPLELQLAFEQIFDRLRWQTQDMAEPRVRRHLARRPKGEAARPPTNEEVATELFTELLRRILYRGEVHRTQGKAKRSDTLSLVARAVRHSAMKTEAERLIKQVVTFNVDDLLEREVNGRSRRRIPYAVPIYRASAVRPLPSRHALCIYHLHGFVPRRRGGYPHFTENGEISKVQPPAESLVFTDEQYWRALANASGFASRVFLGALSGRCIFIGLSMTDLNLIRWLAQDAIERNDDFRRLASGWADPLEAEFNTVEEISRHYWITMQPSPDHESNELSIGDQALRGTLQRRGVECIDIPAWDSREFHDWWKRCFLS
jgi:hypothetical protein